jgi:hypothetical protein
VKHMSYFKFLIAKSKLLNELADGLTRLLKLPRLFYILLWHVMWYRFKMLIYVLGESTPTNSIGNPHASNGNNAKIKVTSIFNSCETSHNPNFLLLLMYYSSNIILYFMRVFKKIVHEHEQEL